LKVKRVLISQPDPGSEKSPYQETAEKYGLKVDFRPFITVEGVNSKEFRQQKVDILAHTAVIFTARTAIDHFFRICEELRITVPETMKYFCISESIALYLQKYIVYRKRKIFFGTGKFEDLMDSIAKHKDEKFILPLSDIHKPEIPKALDKAKITYSKSILFKTVSSDLKDLSIDKYDLMIFYSPAGITSLKENFPDFAQSERKIGAFGPAASKAVRDAGFTLDIEAPTPEAPSMGKALELFIKKNHKENK